MSCLSRLYRLYLPRGCRQAKGAQSHQDSASGLLEVEPPKSNKSPEQISEYLYLPCVWEASRTTKDSRKTATNVGLFKQHSHPAVVCVFNPQSALPRSMTMACIQGFVVRLTPTNSLLMEYPPSLVLSFDSAGTYAILRTTTHRHPPLPIPREQASTGNQVPSVPTLTHALAANLSSM